MLFWIRIQDIVVYSTGTGTVPYVMDSAWA